MGDSVLNFFYALFEVFFCAMAGRGRGQSVNRGRGRGGVLSGEACRSGRATNHFRAYDEVGFEGVQRGMPAARVDGGGEQARRVAGRSQGDSVPASDSAATWQREVSDLPNVGFMGRDVEDSHDPVGSRGCGRGSGSVRPVKGKNFVPEEERQLTQSVLAIS